MIKFPRTTLLASLLGLALAVPAGAQEPAHQDDDAPMSHGLSAVDQKVVSESLHAGRKEIEAARLAKSRSTQEAIRELATDIERDHTGLNERLEGIGGGVRPFAAPATASGGNHDNPAPDSAAPGTPPTVATDHDLSMLDGLQGAEFDAAWLQMMIDGHKTSVERFRSGAEGGGAEVMGLSKDALVIVRRHLSRLEALQKQ
ncbi:MAG: DUF4142 domain-containing protein [Arenimonas sp.]|uniref:DUF4142 domain-containing protein n=1 Tax=Arenimonas sp. TaxID=1872635 RepID=UPI0025C34367|nr:DUF4142 domain-containing protein [Arenimonas sp.]MBW8368246.1 DUF4142 domain-containing protein [Arenimonas sp.]